jgi:hypothetical protein
MSRFKFSLGTLLIWLFLGAGGMALTFNFPRQLDGEKLLRDSGNSPFLSPQTTHVGYGFPFENRAKEYVIVDPSELRYEWIERAYPWGIAANLLFYFGFVALAPFQYIQYVRWAREHDPAHDNQSKHRDTETQRTQRKAHE